MHVLLETERLILRRFTAEDADLLFGLHNDPDVMQYINAGAPVSRQEVQGELSHFMSFYDRFDGYGFWAAVEKQSRRFIGWFHFRPGEGAGPLEPELGYRLHKFAWNQGYATEGSRALIDMGFERQGVERVTAETMAVHHSSRRVMEKAGLRLHRHFKTEWPVPIPGDEHGDVEYTLDRAQWASTRTQTE